MTGPMGWPLPDPVRLDPPPGEPAGLADLGEGLDASAAFLGDLGEQLSGAPAAGCGWAGDDAAAADAQVQRVGALARDAAEALRCAAGRVRRHGEVLSDARRRVAQLAQAQTEDFGATVLRMGAGADPGTGLPGPAAAAAVEELQAAEVARGRLHASVLAAVEEDAAATAAVLVACSAVAGGGADEASAVRHLEDLLPGWHASALGRRGTDFAVAFRSGGLADREAAARELLPWAGNGAVAAAVLGGLGAEGVREALRLLGDGSLSDGSALAGVLAAALGAPVPFGAADEVAGVRDVRHVDPDDVRSLDADHVALGMGVVLAAGRRSGRAGPSPATVREWGRQIVARERALGAPVLERLHPSPALPGDPLEEVLGRLARADAGAQAAQLLRGEPTWTHLLSRSWDDDGAAFAAVVARAAAEPSGSGDVVVRSGLRALAVGLGDDGDPAGWTVDRATAAAVAPSLADALAARPEVLVEPLTRAAAGAGEQDRLVLRGLGHLSADPAAVVLDRAVDDLARAGAGPEVAVPAGYAAVREYGQRLTHALDEFAAQEQAGRRAHITELGKESLGHVPRGDLLVSLVAVGAVLGDLDGTWDASPDPGEHVSVEDAVRGAGGAPGAATAYAQVAEVLGAPVAPLSPPIDWVGLITDLVPAGDRVEEVVRIGVDRADEFLDEHVRDPARG